MAIVLSFSAVIFTQFETNSVLFRGTARIQKKYLKISRKFLTLMMSQLMTPHEETNSAKKTK